MSELLVESIPQVNVSQDGMTISIKLVLKGGMKHTLVVSYEQIDWLAQAFLSACNAAYQQQVKTGRISEAIPIASAMKAEAVRVLPNTQTKEAVLQMLGSSNATGSRGIGSCVLNEFLINSLGERLLEVAAQFRQVGNLS